MMGRTHALLGIDTVWILLALPPFANAESSVIFSSILAAVFGALLPDLDAPASLLQNVSLGGIRPFRLLALAAGRYGHRGPLHSFLGLGLVAVLTLPVAFYSPMVWLALLLGYLSHLAADACTRGGIRWRYPRREKLYLLPPRLRLVTGSPSEDAVFALAAGAALYLLIHLMFSAHWAVYP